MDWSVCVDPKEKQNASEISQAASLEGLSPHVPLYKVTEGNECCFFTTYFSWDHTKDLPSRMLRIMVSLEV
ncbi:hypothetical protein AAZX31_06G244900 [Glycine max]